MWIKLLQLLDQALQNNDKMRNHKIQNGEKKWRQWLYFRQSWEKVKESLPAEEMENAERYFEEDDLKISTKTNWEKWRGCIQTKYVAICFERIGSIFNYLPHGQFVRIEGGAICTNCIAN